VAFEGWRFRVPLRSGAPEPAVALATRAIGLHGTRGPGDGVVQRAGGEHRTGLAAPRARQGRA